ncbi:MAG: DUF2190 family protein [Pirellulales bacterium]|nr:DUF2190 family protein [Pirellulales bacterium]
MADYFDSRSRTFRAGAVLPAFARVKLSAGALVLAGTGIVDEPVEIGVTEHAAQIGDLVAVDMRSGEGTTKMIASGAIAAGIRVFGETNGRIRSATSGRGLGVSLEEATADGQVIEVLRY